MRESMLKLGQFNGFAACINSTIQMLNDVWNGLVNDIKNTKRCFNELEAALTATNEHLNDGLLAVLKSMDKLETKGCSLQAMYNNMWILVNVQEHRIRDLDNKVNFYSQSLVKLEGEKAEWVRDCINSLEQCIAGQDGQIKVLLRCLVAAEEGHCRCGQGSSKVISCHCFDVITKLTGGVQETKVELETGGLEYEDEEVEAFCRSLILRN